MIPDAQLLPFIEAIVNVPGDPLPRLIFSEWLEEWGEDAAAEGQRYLASQRKFPLPIYDNNWTTGGWYSRSDSAYVNKATLPELFFDSATWGGVSIWMQPSLIDCELAFIHRSREIEWLDGKPVGERTLETETTPCP